MIGWLQGQVLDLWQQSNRCGLLLVVSGVGYEVQLTRRQFAALPPVGASLVLHIHHAIREDGWQLFGFAERSERDLFRELVAVSGVGPQVALALLGELPAKDLVSAIIHADLRLLARAPGVGKRTAERLSVELRTRLQQRFSAWIAVPGDLEEFQAADAAEGDAVLDATAREEVHLTLAALGYEPLEIQRALRAVRVDPADDPNAWIRAALGWLSRDVA